MVDVESTLDLRPSSGAAPTSPSPPGSDDVPSRTKRRSPAGARRAATAAALVGVLVTALLTWAAWAAHHRNEDRLLDQRAREVAAALGSALPSVQTPLASAAELGQATGGDIGAFERFAARIAGEGRQFRAAALWSSDDSMTPIATVGDLGLLDEPPDVIRHYLEQGAATPQLTVVDLLDRPEPRLGYLFPSTQQPGYLAYAESALPPNRAQQVREGQAFRNLDFALYLGQEADPSELLIATTPDLPLGGRTAREPVPFGDSSFLLVTSARGSLGGSLMAALPWIIAIAGLLMTAVATAAIRRLIDGRFEAEQLSRQIEDLYERQRTIAQTLQRNLLPDRLAQPPGLRVSARYEAGAQGMEIGGDWYDVVETDRGLLMVIGDVSGRGLGAGATMAELRFSARAYAQEGHAPDGILARLGNLLDVGQHGHFATVLCARLDTSARRLEVASAGHPGPVLLEGGRARLLPVAAGMPVGVRSDTRYDAMSVDVAPGATFLAFTDGLYERRGESVDDGLERVRRRVEDHADATLDELLDRVLADLIAESDDDTAILGVRWESPTP